MNANPLNPEDAFKTPPWPEKLVAVDPLISVLVETGHALDCLGMLKGVKLARDAGETDDAYRARLIPKLRTARP